MEAKVQIKSDIPMHILLLKFLLWTPGADESNMAVSELLELATKWREELLGIEQFLPRPEKYVKSRSFGLVVEVSGISSRAS